MLVVDFSIEGSAMRRSSDSLASIFAACILTLFSSVVAAAEAVQPAARELMRQNPGLRVHWEGGRITAIYGRPMGNAAKPAQAAAAWWQQHADAFGVPDLSLRMNRTREAAKEHDGPDQVNSSHHCLRPSERRRRSRVLPSSRYEYRWSPGTASALLADRRRWCS